MAMNNSESRVFTISEITRALKVSIEGSDLFSRIWVKGEIYNLTFHSSGHIYFSLKDDNAVISAVFFKSYNARMTFKLEEGMSILAFGSITVFEKRGSYQISVLQVRPEGIGELQKRIEQLKKKLSLEGIFDPTRKRPIPFLPRRIGIATSPTGAAVRDIIKVALRRFPNIEIIIAPVQVQGSGAVASIVKGIRELNKPKWNIDVIIAGRGGGSFEDLMPFNEEPVIRAFYESRVPIISAVGHQIDHPLCDDAADLAAPTPSAAAELAIPIRQEFVDEIGYYNMRMSNAIFSYLRERQMRIDAIASRPVFVNPREVVRGGERLLSDLTTRVVLCVKEAVGAGRKRLLEIPDIRMIALGILSNKKYKFALALNTLETMSPLSIIKRGYAIVLDENKNVVRSVHTVRVNESIGLHLHDGFLGCTVDSIDKGGLLGKEKDDKSES